MRARQDEGLAKEVVAKFCVNNSLLHSTEYGIDHLTSCEVFNDDLPWFQKVTTTEGGPRDELLGHSSEGIAAVGDET